MRPIRGIEDVRELREDELIVQCWKGEVSFYKFLCIHPHDEDCVILLDSFGDPKRFHIQHLMSWFYTDYTPRDLVNYRKRYALGLIRMFDEELAKMDGKANTEG